MSEGERKENEVTRSWGEASEKAPQRCLVTRTEQCLVLPAWADD